MRYAGMIILLVSVMSGGCEKNSHGRPGTATGDLTGTWELRETSGNIPVKMHPAGNGNILSYHAGGYTWRTGGQVVKTGQFTVVQDTTIVSNVCLLFPEGTYTNRLIYDNNTDTTKIFFEVHGNKLRFYSACYAYDAGHSELYEKIEDVTGK